MFTMPALHIVLHLLGKCICRLSFRVANVDFALEWLVKTQIFSVIHIYIYYIYSVIDSFLLSTWGFGLGVLFVPEWPAQPHRLTCDKCWLMNLDAISQNGIQILVWPRGRPAWWRGTRWLLVNKWLICQFLSFLQTSVNPINNIKQKPTAE